MNIDLITRTQNKSFLKKALSDDYRMIRRRKYTISIQMTFTSWTLEAISGIFVLVITLFFAYDASLEIATQVFIAIHVFLYFIVIPGSYLLNTEVYKNVIFKKGWSIVFPCRKRRRQVAPETNEEAQLNVVNEGPPRNEKVQSNADKDATAQNNGVQSTYSVKKNNTKVVIVKPIPTISGNVNLETSYRVY